MATYKNTSGVNIDTYLTQNPDGSLVGKVGYVRRDEVFSAVDAILHLKITSGSQSGKYIKRAGLTLQVSSPPPPPSTGTSYILLYSYDGDPNPRRFVEVE